ncbi:hypothetical protein K440DRAFT_641252 [Wilcoxina mikolae CBS 423.85]|nr:hypothetical protein K440DRAFT_641252 [Wilcoxina mikolae CBS 423.85]
MNPPNQQFQVPNPIKNITAKELETHRSTIQSLFNKRHSLAEVQNIMQQEHNFRATNSQIKRKKSAWKIRKNIPRRKMVYILRKRRKRQAQGKETIIKFHGQPTSLLEPNPTSQHESSSTQETNDFAHPTPRVPVGATCLSTHNHVRRTTSTTSCTQLLDREWRTEGKPTGSSLLQSEAGNHYRPPNSVISSQLVVSGVETVPSLAVTKSPPTQETPFEQIGLQEGVAIHTPDFIFSRRLLENMASYSPLVYGHGLSLPERLFYDARQFVKRMHNLDALHKFHQALKELERNHNCDSQFYPVILSSIDQMYSKMGSRNMAFEFTKNALDRLNFNENNVNPALASLCFYNIAEVFSNEGCYDIASKIYLQALSEREKIETAAGDLGIIPKSHLLSTTGQSFFKQGKYKVEAMNCLERGLTEYKRSANELAPCDLDSAYNAGMTSEKLGLLSKAFEYYLLALAGFMARFADDPTKKIRVLQSLQSMHQKWGRSCSSEVILCWEQIALEYTISCWREPEQCELISDRFLEHSVLPVIDHLSDFRDRLVLNDGTPYGTRTTRLKLDCQRGAFFRVELGLTGRALVTVQQV